MYRRVVDAHDFSFDRYRPQNPDRGAESICYPFCNTRLAVTRFTEQEHPTTRIDRRPQSIQHSLINNQSLERTTQILLRDDLSGDALS